MPLISFKSKISVKSIPKWSMQPGRQATDRWCAKSYRASGDDLKSLLSHLERVSKMWVTRVFTHEHLIFCFLHCVMPVYALQSPDIIVHAIKQLLFSDGLSGPVLSPRLSGECLQNVTTPTFGNSHLTYSDRVFFSKILI